MDFLFSLILTTTLLSFLCLKLLNEKNDDEDDETRSGGKKRNELLHQLMKDQDEVETRKLPEPQVRLILQLEIKIYN